MDDVFTSRHLPNRKRAWRTGLVGRGGDWLEAEALADGGEDVLARDGGASQVVRAQADVLVAVAAGGKVAPHSSDQAEGGMIRAVCNSISPRTSPNGYH